MHARTGNDIVIVRTGAVTPVGLNQATTASSLRWGLRRFSQHNWQRLGADFKGCDLGTLPFLPPDSLSHQRMTYLGQLAATEALQPWLYAQTSLGLECKLPVLIATPPPRPGLSRQQCKQTALDIIANLPINLDEYNSGIYCTGHDGGVAALEYAKLMIQSGEYAACLLGGVGSCMHPDYINMLIELHRMRCSDNTPGFVPAEGAGFLLICTKSFAQEQGWSQMAYLGSVIRTQESALWYDSTLIGAGEALVNALRTLYCRKTYAGPLADRVYSDMNGEAWRTQEWEHAYLHTRPYFPDSLTPICPAEQWGDLNAATAPLLIGLCAYEMSRRHIDDRVALISTAADAGPDRALTLIHRQALVH